MKDIIERRDAKIQTQYDKTFFEKIDSHEKAYVLGLIMTDGYIIRNYMGFGIQLTKSDGYILEKISKILRSTHPLQFIRKRKKDNKNYFVKDMMRLSIYNQKIANDLKKMGVVKYKTKKLRYNNSVPKKYLSSFFRGLIDGDGTIGVNKTNNYPWCKISSFSNMFLEDLKKIDLPFKFNINISFTKYKEKKHKIFNLVVSGGKNEIKQFLKWIYKNKGDFYLERKYEKMQNCLCT